MLARDEPLLWVRLSVVWAQARQMLRLHVVPPGAIRQRTDLVSGGPLERPLDGLEYPLNGGMVVGAEADRLAIVAPEVFSVSADTHAVDLTLLRSPYVAHHDPTPAARRPDHPVTDQGYHEFDLAFWPNCPPGTEGVARLARGMIMPPIAWDLTG
jgi:alpha-mannosidase